MKSNDPRSIKSFLAGARSLTIFHILKVPLSMVHDWESGRELPDKDQADSIKKINSPLRRIRCYLSSKIAHILQ